METVLIDLRPKEGPIKSPLSVYPSICQFCIFLRNDWLVFTEFLHGDR